MAEAKKKTTPAKKPAKKQDTAAAPQKADSKEKGKYHAAVGRRKQATSTVRLFEEGEAGITINGHAFEEYFPGALQQQRVLAPLEAVGKKDAYYIKVYVNGGGKEGQTGAVQLGIARALLLVDPEWKTTLRSNGLLTRDPRVKERKKFGLKKARRSPQWSKR